MTNFDQQSAGSPARVLRLCGGAVLVVALALAPLNFGSTRLVPLQTLIALLAVGSVAWLVAGAIERSLQWPPRPMIAGAALLVVSGLAWCFVLTPPAVPEFTREHFARIVERWPYSVVPRQFGLSVALWASSLVGLFALVEMARAPGWRRALVITMVAVGAVIALLGLVENATGARGIYWDTTHRMPGTFFGTFFHHTAAGAYLNTVWPLGFGLGLSWVQQGYGRSVRGRLALCAVLACTVLMLAAHTGHVSRFPQVIAMVGLVGLGIWTRAWSVFGQTPGLRRILSAMAVGLLIAGVALGATKFGTISSRWSQLKFNGAHEARLVVAPPPVAEWPKLVRDDLFIPSDHRNYVLGDRGATYSAAFAAIADRPWFGWGPGGWMAAAAAHSPDPFVRTFFLTVQFTHNDFLQTCVEWGLVGAAGWMLLVPAAVVHGFAKAGLHPDRDYVGAAATVALSAVLIQSLIDFPLQIPAVHSNALALTALAWTTPAVRSGPALQNFSHERI